ncbi:phenylalanine--tRNA ligase subunit alpha [Erysipelothrix sp. HDW6A]|uniref:phenylalanine--tRNA ligase subunit alpha n=1 Tax=Erysipelothrix sp. HDW6A TaxID=2714928 RepID=UPI00140E0102|nr:phenylalanine--tRNA ligase subunit alpha [Erysipelothrix sp. HDW6A]QIK57617.1 phenylalanine--tRNA ligase subunit alpha [Erysipelothrix sp. HDW6A]
MELKDIIVNGLEAINKAETLEQLNEVRIAYLSKKGHLTSVMGQMRNLSNEERPMFGKKVNEVKEKIESAYQQKVSELEAIRLERKMKEDAIDITLPGPEFTIGAQNPLIIIQREIEDVFREMGYQVVEGDEIELDLYNFERANIPQDHPAREMQDTFYIDEHTLLRTHTTAIQTRALEENAPHIPLKVICPGKVYRRDDDDATHSHQFVQTEGLVVGHNITLSDLKGTLSLFAKRMFGDDRVIRFRPSYFQFTEPSVEVDVSCHICNGKGCNVCKHTGWIEILGAGMVHPHVLRDAGYTDPTLTGFAFGAGVERIAMLKYGIEDIRSFYTNDKRFIEQFKRYE